MTFSIAARCARTGMLGIAVSSSSPAVAARCAYARAQVGAVGSQNITDPTLGPRLLDLMALGATAPEAVRIVAGSAAHITFRQLLAVVDGSRAGRERVIRDYNLATNVGRLAGIFRRRLAGE